MAVPCVEEGEESDTCVEEDVSRDLTSLQEALALEGDTSAGETRHAHVTFPRPRPLALGPRARRAGAKPIHTFARAVKCLLG